MPLGNCPVCAPGYDSHDSGEFGWPLQEGLYIQDFSLAYSWQQLTIFQQSWCAPRCLCSNSRCDKLQRFNQDACCDSVYTVYCFVQKRSPSVIQKKEGTNLVKSISAHRVHRAVDSWMVNLINWQLTVASIINLVWPTTVQFITLTSTFIGWVDNILRRSMGWGDIFWVQRMRQSSRGKYTYFGDTRISL